jgi:dihydrofolate reductase
MSNKVMPIKSIIVAVDNNNAIGKDNKLLWHLPGDLKYFKAVTNNHTVIMGHNTYKSLPNGALPNRRNIVISRDKNLSYPNVEVYSSLDDAIEKCQNEKEVFIIGGAMIYKDAISIADKLYITLVDHTFGEADTFFPEINKAEWVEISKTENPADEKNSFAYSFVIYERKQSIKD